LFTTYLIKINAVLIKVILILHQLKQNTMRLKFTTLSACLLLGSTAFAQEMNGFRTDNYNGVNGAFFNPANLGNSPYKLDIGLFGMNIFAGNKNMDFSFGTMSDIGDDDVLNNLLGKGKANSILVNATFHLPSISYRINEKTTVALVTRSRILFNVHDFDGTLLSSITDSTNELALPYSLNSNQNMRISTNIFSEYGVSGGHVVYNEGNHFIKVGATLKYLSGVGNAYLQLDKINATLDSNGNSVVATKASGTVSMGAAGIDVDDPQFSMGGNAAGFGADLGAVYEFRTDELKGEAIPYLFKGSVALLDIGSIKYDVIANQTAGYTVNIPTGQYFNMSEFDGDTKETFDNNPQYFTKKTAASSYRVALPRTLQIGGDYRALKGVYVAANLQLAMSNNETKAYNPRAVNAITITPRYESKLVAAYLPINYSNLSKMTIGLGFRAGPLYAGSSSLVSMMISKSKQMDFYFGFRVGFKTKQKKDSDEG
jgi:hypothetical protein